MIKVCKNGHSFEKSSTCPVCPICEKGRVPKTGFFSLLSAPARRALENAGITTLVQLSKHNEKDILNLHGVGPASMPILRKALMIEDLEFAVY